MAAVLEQKSVRQLSEMSFNEQLERCGVSFDANGKPVLYSHDQVMSGLAKKIVGFYGEKIREPLNESLSKHHLSRI